MVRAQRPVVITILAYLLIAGGIVGVFTAPFAYLVATSPRLQQQFKLNMRNPEVVQKLSRINVYTVGLEIAAGLAGAVVGVFMLAGATWSRHAYAAILVLNIPYRIFLGVPSGLWMALIFITILLLVGMYSQRANQFFAAANARAPRVRVAMPPDQS